MSPFFSFFRTDFSHDGALSFYILCGWAEIGGWPRVWLGGDWWVAEGVAGRTALLPHPLPTARRVVRLPTKSPKKHCIFTKKVVEYKKEIVSNAQNQSERRYCHACTDHLFSLYHMRDCFTVIIYYFQRSRRLL